MYLSASDPRELLAAWCLETTMTDAEFAATCKDIERLKEWPRQGNVRPAVILTLDDAPKPTALQRQTLGQLTGSPKYDPYIAIVTVSPIIRGTLTALRWLSPQTRYVETTHATVESAVACLEKQRGSTLPALRAMLVELSLQARGKLLKEFAPGSLRFRAATGW